MNTRSLRWASPAALLLGLVAPGSPASNGAQEARPVLCGSWDLRHRDAVTCLAFAPRSTGALVLVSGGLEGDLFAWDPRTGEALEGLALRSGASLRGAAVLPDGALRLATVSGDVERVGRIGEGGADSRARTRLAADAGVLLAAAPDGGRLCATGRDGAARILDAVTGDVLHAIELADPDGEALALAAGPSAFAPASDLVVAIGLNRAKALRRAGTAEQPSSVLVVLDAATGERVRRIESKERVLVDVAVTSGADAMIVAVDDAGAVRTWGLLDGAPRGVFATAPDNPVSATALALGPASPLAPGSEPAGAWAAVARADGELILVALEDGAELGRARVASRGAPIDALAVAPDGSALAASSGTQIELFELPSLIAVAPRFRHAGPVSAVAWSADGARLATGSYDRGARVWRAADGAGEAAFDANAGFVYGVALGTDAAGEPVLFTAGQDGAVRAFDLGAGEDAAPRFTALAHTAACTALALSPDGATLATAGADGVVRLLDAHTGAELASFDGIPGAQPRLAWFAAGDRLAVGASDVRVIDAATRTVVRKLARPRAPITSLAVAPDGTAIAAGLANKAIALFDLEGGDGDGAALLEGHAGRVQAVAFSADGARLASASSNELGARLWDVARRAELAGAALGGLRREALALAFSPSGDRLAAGSMDGTAVIWPLAD